MSLCNYLRYGGLAILITLISACSVVGPEYTPPDTAVTAHYKQPLEAGEHIAAEKDLEPEWWLLFNDARLNALMAQVESRNYSLQAAKAKLDQARAAAVIARAKQYPRVDAGGKNDLGILASWEVDLWGRIKRNIEASNAEIQATEADLAAVRLSLQAQLAENYFLLRIQDEEIRLLQDTIRSYQKSLQIARNQYDAGVVDRVVVEQAQAQLSSTQAQWYNARITRAKLEHSLAVLTGQSPVEFALEAQPFDVKLPPVPVAVASELLQRRPDIAAAERQMAASSARIGVAEASTYPSLKLSLGLSIRDVLIGGEELFAPLHASGALKAVTAKARAEYQRAVARYQQTVIEAFKEVEDNLVTLNILQKASQAQSKAVASSRKVVEIMTNQYKAGIVTYQSIIIAQTTALTDERRELSILGQQLSSSILLIKALGGGWHQSVLQAETQ